MTPRESVLVRRLQRAVRRAAKYRAKLQCIRREEQSKRDLQTRSVLEGAIFHLMRAVDSLGSR